MLVSQHFRIIEATLKAYLLSLNIAAALSSVKVRDHVRVENSAFRAEVAIVKMLPQQHQENMLLYPAQYFPLSPFK